MKSGRVVRAIVRRDGRYSGQRHTKTHAANPIEKQTSSAEASATMVTTCPRKSQAEAPRTPSEAIAVMLRNIEPGRLVAAQSRARRRPSPVEPTRATTRRPPRGPAPSRTAQAAAGARVGLSGLRQRRQEEGGPNRYSKVDEERGRGDARDLRTVVSTRGASDRT